MNRLFALLVFGYSLPGFAQQDSTSRKIMIGLDLGKTLFINVMLPTSRGLILRVLQDFILINRLSFSQQSVILFYQLTQFTKTQTIILKVFFWKIRCRTCHWK